MNRKFFVTVALGVALLASALFSTPAKSDPLTLGVGIGYAISLFTAGELAYCQATMEKDSTGKVVKQNPNCNGGGPVVIGSTTVNPYNTAAKPCTRDPKRGWQCPS